AYVAIATLRGAVHLLQDVGCVLDVANRDLFVYSLGIEFGPIQLREFVGIVVAARDRLLEDRRVRSDPGQSVLIDMALEFAAGDKTAANVIEPYGLSIARKRLQRIHGCESGGAD